jgi:hypothetical protein
MRHASRLIAVAVGILGICVQAPLFAQAPQVPNRAAAAAGSGTIESVVQDETGAPVAGAVVTATGASTVFGVTDRFGRATLRSLSPGPYLVRAHITGFAAPRVQTVEVLAGSRASSAISLRRVNAVSASSPMAAPPILPASVGGFLGAPEPAVADPPAASVTPQAAGDHDAPDTRPADADGRTNGNEIEWRLRHARRSILNEAVDQVAVADASPVEGSGGYVDRGRTSYSAGGAARVASNFFSETPFFGQVNLLTTSSFEAPLDLFTTKAFVSRSVANILLGAPVGDNADWTVRGALTQGDIASWVVFGDYMTRAKARHRYDIGLSYSTQRYDGGNFAALRNVTDGSRNVGTMHGFDTFAVTPALAVTYGTRFAHYDYLEGKNLVSPRVGLVLTPAKHVRVNALASVHSLAPGAEEFMPPTDMGIWLPPQRTFSEAFDGSPMVAERTLHVEAGIERDLTAVTTISVRAFSQHVDNQLVTLFTPATLGHYFVANGGRVEANGYAAGIRTVIAGRVHGSIEYSFARAERSALESLTYFVFLTPASTQSINENVHDLSTSIETDVPETSTHVAVLCRLSDGFARRDAWGRAGVDARFDVQVRQALPFMDFSSAKWEMLVAVRNFFHDAATDQSIYDELLVVRSPKRVVGGLTLRF